MVLIDFLFIIIRFYIDLFFFGVCVIYKKIININLNIVYELFLICGFIDLNIIFVLKVDFINIMFYYIVYWWLKIRVKFIVVINFNSEL